MSPFFFDGRIPPSKSLMNRWLCIASYRPEGFIEIDGDSSCDDVVQMRKGVAALRAGQPIDCGAAGTVFRFMALRASRIPGKHRLLGTPRLLSRPQGPLLHILQHFGVKAEIREGALEIESKGWQHPSSVLEIDRSVSSQFVSSLVLNAWDLEFPLFVRSSVDSVSDSYFDMTLAVVREAGMILSEEGERLIGIAPDQAPRHGRARLEPDMSSAVAVAALGVVGGEARLREFPERSLQPDRVFVAILQAMGADIRQEGNALVFRKSALRGVEWNLRDCPDLFPVLSILCALAEGPSRLYGAKHLVHKESNRIAHSAILVRAIGRECIVRDDGMEIGAEWGVRPASPIIYESDEDHRLVMAGAVARRAGYDVCIQHPECVGKSYPEFLQVAGL